MRYPILFILFIHICGVAYSQNYFEIGGQIGGSLYMGDLTPSNVSTTFNEVKPILGAQVRWTTPRISVGLEFHSTRLSGHDSNSDDETRIARNFSFESPLYELALMAEINVFKFDPLYSERIFTPYAKIGLAGFYFNPLTYYNGQWVELQPLGTEGQGTSAYPDRKKYSRYQIAIPIGGGGKFRIADGLAIFADMVWRYTFTDYIDDVSTSYAERSILRDENGSLAVELAYREDEYYGSDVYPNAEEQRGGSSVDDYYMFATIGLRYTLDGAGFLPFRNVRRKSRVQCPRF